MKVWFPGEKKNNIIFLCFSTRFTWYVKCTLFYRREWVQNPANPIAVIPSLANETCKAFAVEVSLLSLFLLFSMSEISNPVHILQVLYACIFVYLSFLWSCGAEALKTTEKITYMFWRLQHSNHMMFTKLFCVDNWGFLDFKYIWKYYLVSFFD